jgi:beta-galactosidase/beta-glucuronidase
MAFAKLTTPQAEALTDKPWQEYPRPQLRREAYLNLNGYWDFAVTQTKALPESYDRQILVPFCPESALSGIGQHFAEGASLFYRRKLILPTETAGCRVLLHIGAVDQIAEVYVNQILVGNHAGGYEAMTFDITHALKEENELVIRAEDDLRSAVFPYGKQVMNRGGMWYTPVSGIWQTVWVEWVPEEYIQALDIRVDAVSATVTTTPALNGTVTLEGREYPLVNGTAELCPEAPHLWTPEDPFLYNFTVAAGEDRVESYFALRTIESKVVNGVPRLCLNGRPYFFHGLLDQGYWPDGLFTPASAACFESDIQAMKALGFNTLRKHIKVEPALFYYACDRLGMVVFQDMVNNGRYSFLRDTALPTVGIQKMSDKHLHRDPATRKAFCDGLEAAVRQLKNHPSILYWTIFNEGWGQFDSTPVYRRLKELVSSRIIDTTSGWFRGSETDVDSRHIYFGKWNLKPSDKPLVLSEFGGYVYRVEGHTFNPDKTYGYRMCPSREAFEKDLETLYRDRVIPAAAAGLCAAIYTQVSDVEDEINGLVTYDRKVVKAQKETMLWISKALQKEME